MRGIRALSRAEEMLRSPTPYVLSNRALKKQWVPPYNVSGLPLNIRVKIPVRFRYWTTKDITERTEVRDNLISEIKKKLKSKRWGGSLFYTIRRERGWCGKPASENKSLINYYRK